MTRVHWNFAQAVFLTISVTSYGAARADDGIAAASAPSAILAAQATADDKKKLEEYRKARQKFNEETASYWKAIDEKRRARIEKRRTGQPIALNDYVLSQPPVYSGPARPPSAPTEPLPPRKPVPVVADFLKFAAAHFKFVPQLPKDEIEFKQAYAKVASAAGLTKEQAVRIYGFESGGNGNYDVQAGLEYPKPDAKAISTALGYNQLLSANTVELLAEQGDEFVKSLERKAAGASAAQQKTLHEKITILKKMIALTHSVPDTWGDHVRLGNTPEGLGIHALNLDVDIGPLLQTQKLMNSVIFAKKKGYQGSLSAAELEMMNLTGDGNGFDMVLMPASFRNQVPTSNFFQQGGYERNSVARRNNVVDTLISATNTKMDKEIRLQGAKDLAAAF